MKKGTFSALILIFLVQTLRLFVFLVKTKQDRGLASKCPGAGVPSECVIASAAKQSPLVEQVSGLSRNDGQDARSTEERIAPSFHSSQ